MRTPQFMTTGLPEIGNTPDVLFVFGNWRGQPLRRWRHLGFVAGGAWLVSLINVAFFGVSIPEWIGSAIAMAIMMGLGGAISGVLRSEIKPSVQADAQKTKTGSTEPPMRTEVHLDVHDLPTPEKPPSPQGSTP